MASWYDDKLMNWVGIMDADQFYAECDRSNAKFFRNLITAWTKKAGCFLKWETGGVCLYGYIDGKKAEVCSLAPQCQRSDTQDHVLLACATFVEYISKDRAEKRQQEIRAAAGQQSLIGSTRIEIVQPGLLPRAKQAALLKALVDVL